MLTDGKVTEIFFMSDEFTSYFYASMEKYFLKDNKKRKYFRPFSSLSLRFPMTEICISARYLIYKIEYIYHASDKLLHYELIILLFDLR